MVWHEAALVNDALVEPRHGFVQVGKIFTSYVVVIVGVIVTIPELMQERGAWQPRIVHCFLALVVLVVVLLRKIKEVLPVAVQKFGCGFGQIPGIHAGIRRIDLANENLRAVRLRAVAFGFRVPKLLVQEVQKLGILILRGFRKPFREI